MIKTTAHKIYIALIFIFMYAPIATLVVLSFNASKTRAKWGGFTTKWYTQLFSNSEIMQALYNTLLIALLSAVFATLIGTIAALSIQGMKKKSRAVLMSITNIPMLNAEIVTGISLMLLFLTFKARFGFITILLSHITFNIPYVILSVMPRLKQLNPSVYEAALDLGASPWQAFFKVVFPLLKPTTATLVILNVLAFWNDYLLPSLVLGKKNLYTLPLSTYSFYGTYSSDYGVIMAALVLTVAPILVLYLFLQKEIIDGVVAGAVKS